MELVQINPFPRYIGRHLMSRTNDECSICYDCRLFYILSGEGVIQINAASELPLRKGNALYLPPATVYQFQPSGENPLQFMVFDFDLLDSFCSRKNSLGTAFESTFQPERVQRTQAPDVFQSYLLCGPSCPIQNDLYMAEEAILEQPEKYTPIVSALLKLSLVKMADQAQRTTESVVVNEACAYIRQNYDREISNLEVASQFHYHPNYLNKIMKETLGVTIRQYLISHRIKIAKSILASTDRSIADVAWEVGFPSPSYFVKVFHREVGKTPLQYRKDTQINNY